MKLTLLRDRNFLIGLSITLGLALIFFYFKKEYVSFLPFILTWIAIGISYMLVAIGINYTLDKFYPWDTTQNRINLNIITYTVVFFFVSIIISFLETKTWNSEIDLKSYLHNRNYQFKIFSYFFTSLFFTFFFHARAFYKQLIASKLKEKELIEAKHISEIQSLRNQLDPHFLFNNLSVLHSLIDENPEKAKEFTHQITQNYRGVLQVNSKEIISVEEDLQIAINYFNLMKIRYENEIDLFIDNSLALTQKILPLSIQMGIENAIKHNIISEQKPLKIKIYGCENALMIENALQPKKVQNSSQLGLKNLEKRYQQHHKKLKYSSDNHIFRLEIPYLDSYENSDY